MKIEYESICSEAEDILVASSAHLPLAWMVRFLLDYAETGVLDPDELQDIGRQIRIGLDERIDGE